jgi:hypothetical protein
MEEVVAWASTEERGNTRARVGCHGMVLVFVGRLDSKWIGYWAFYENMTSIKRCRFTESLNLTAETIRVTWINQTAENGGRLVSLI